MEIKNQKKRSAIKGILLLLVSIALGGAGVFFSKQFIENKISFYRSQMEVKDELAEVVVPKRNLLKGEVVTGDLLSLREFPKKYLDTNTIKSNNYQIAIGQKISFDVEKGKPLLWAHLEGGVTPTFSGKIEDGLRALTIRVDELNSISGFLQPQDAVDLMLTYSGSNSGGKITFPFIQNLYVMATGVKTVADKTGRSSGQRYQTITVQVTPENAKKIILAQDMGKITATLRNPDDGIDASKKPMTIADLLDRPKPKPRAVVKKAAPKPVKKGIEFIVGGV